MADKTTIAELPDIRLMVIRADEFPSGLQVAWDRLESRHFSLKAASFTAYRAMKAHK